MGDLKLILRSIRSISKSYSGEDVGKGAPHSIANILKECAEGVRAEEVQALEEKCTCLQRDLASAHAQGRADRARGNHLQRQLEELHGRMVVVGSQSKASCKAAQAENQALLQKIEKLQQMIDTLEKQTMSSQLLKDENDTLMEKVRGLELKLEARNEAVEEAQAQNPIAQELISLQQDENSQLQERISDLEQELSGCKANHSRALAQQADLHASQHQAWRQRETQLREEIKNVAQQLSALQAKEEAAQILAKVLAKASNEEAGVEPLLVAQQQEIEALLAETAKLRKLQTSAKAAQGHLEEAVKGNEILHKENVQLRSDLENLRDQLKQLKVRRAMAAAAGYDLRWTQERAQLEDIVRQREAQLREVKGQLKHQEKMVVDMRQELATAKQQAAEAAAWYSVEAEEENSTCSGQTAGEKGVEAEYPLPQEETPTRREMSMLMSKCASMEEELALNAVEVKSLRQQNRRLSLSLSFGNEPSFDRSPSHSYSHRRGYSITESLDGNISVISTSSEAQLMQQIDDLTQKLAEKEEIIQSFNKYVDEWKKYKQEVGKSSPEKAVQLHAPVFRNPVPAELQGPQSDLVMVLETGMWRVRCEVNSRSQGECVTSAEFPCLVAKPRPGRSNDQVVNPSLLGPDAHPMFHRFCQEGTFVGADAWICVFDHPDPSLRSNLDLVWPLDPKNEQVNKEYIYQLWQSAFDATEMESCGANVVISHKPTEGYKEWSWMVDVLFSMLNVQSVCLVNEAVMTARGSGCSTGVVVDIGEGGTRVTPVYEGFALTTAARRLECGATHLNAYLLHLLSQKRSPILGQALPRRQLEMAREIKESYCFVAEDFDAMVKEKGSMEFKKVCVMGEDFSPLDMPDSPHKNSPSKEDVKLEVPEGESFCFSAGKELFYCPELLFQPDLYSESEHSSGLAEIVVESINACDDEDIRKDLQKTILLSGKTSQLPGLKERLKKELLHSFGESSSMTVSLCDEKQSEVRSFSDGEQKDNTLSPIMKGIRSALKEDNPSIWIDADMYSSNPELLKNYQGY